MIYSFYFRYSVPSQKVRRQSDVIQGFSFCKLGILFYRKRGKDYRLPNLSCFLPYTQKRISACKIQINVLLSSAFVYLKQGTFIYAFRNVSIFFPEHRSLIKILYAEFCQVLWSITQLLICCCSVISNIKYLFIESIGK